jgi:signal transduction histidine kinase
MTDSHNPERRTSGRQVGEPAIWLSAIPANSLQRRTTLAVLAILLTAFVTAAPFAPTPLPQSDGFIPVIQTIIIFADLLTAILLFTQFSLVRSRAVLVLANGYLFSALIVLAHTLTFPSAFAPSGLFGAGIQTAAWLGAVWHFGFPAAVLGYAWLKDRPPSKGASQISTGAAIAWSGLAVIGLVCVITWALTTGDRLLPELMLDTSRFAPLVFYAALLDAIVSAFAFLLLWSRQKYVLDQWVIIAMFATLGEMAMVTFFSVGRFDLGWYSTRFFGVIASTVVLTALLIESTTLYARLARTIYAVKHERDIRLMTVEAATGAIAHELRQPLTAIVAYGAAGLAWMRRTPPELEKLRECLDEMVSQSHRASEVVESLRRLSKTGTASPLTMLEINGVIRETLRLMEHDLYEHGISLVTEYGDNLPQIRADRMQIQKLIINLVRNAVEAMGSCSHDRRSLRIVTGGVASSHVSLYIQDSGPGISAENRNNIFDHFFSTKEGGAGLGLSICRTIVERHGGRLVLTESNSRGSTFEVSFPLGEARAA